MAAAADILPLPPARDVPSAFLASVKSWWSVSEKQAAISEERLLRRLPFFSPSTGSNPNNTHPVIATSTRVHLNAPKHYINTVSITPTASQPSQSVPPTVLLHGYGAGLGFYFRNLPVLANWAAKRNASVYAIDWLGMGLSARVPFSVRARREDIPARVHEAESFFIESLEEWRNKMGLEKMTLIGHSLGAYFSVAYALKYPDRVGRLILLSPAGVPRGPDLAQQTKELADESAGASKSTLDSPTKKQADEEPRQRVRVGNRAKKLYTYLWEEGWTPFQVIRATTFWGPMLIGKVCLASY